MAWDGAISSAATAMTETVNTTPFLKYLAILGGAMWLVERSTVSRLARHGEKTNQP
jgi:hypothetical protein